VFATIFRFAADGSCDRNQHPHLNDRCVCRFIIDPITNIISLAALGFAAGMVVDNAIVVIETSLPICSRVKQIASSNRRKEVAGGCRAPGNDCRICTARVEVKWRSCFADMAITIQLRRSVVDVCH